MSASTSSSPAPSPSPVEPIADKRAGAVDARRRSPLAVVVEGLIRLYRLTAPVRTPRCRFHPSCSTYALEAVSVHGAVRGSWLATRRLFRCHPWNPGGVDHVPPRMPR